MKKKNHFHSYNTFSSYLSGFDVEIKLIENHFKAWIWISRRDIYTTLF